MQFVNVKKDAFKIRDTTDVELLGLPIEHKLKIDTDICKLHKTQRFKHDALRNTRKL